MFNQQYAILTAIDSYIEPLLIRVLSTKKLGVCCETIKIDSLSSSCGKEQGDRFKLSIPYAKQNLVWNVFFDSQCPEMGPDFIFNDNTFLADIDVDTLSVKVPSLANWNPNDENALLNVLKELLLCYKEHQIQLIQKQARLQIEYNMLVTSQEIRQEDIEMILLPFSSKPTEARFLISLSVDLSQLQIRTCKSESDVAVLLVTFSGTDWNRITSQLQFSKSLEGILNEIVELYIPYFPSDTHLIHYILKIKKFIAAKVNSVIQSLEKRREYIAAFLLLKYEAILEFDSIKYTYISCLLCENDFYAVLYIHLPLGFPREPPTIELCSIYHITSQDTVYREKVKNYPYEFTWTPHVMIKRLLTFIQRNVETFKSNSIKNCSAIHD
ncbi:BRISC and BRCA1-A complex member 2 [Apis mellifera caucasica]|uniref:BRISC and BRCA1-A complex member 2 n=1 Tax=Apis mellifera TaxID=7460 RepID=A0A7M7R649_APIME|nr:BRISC and BRCA1-A complex member 2 [Apis mellifera]KAG6802092.1 BRISC and BRCA1-A complex member 2 [Apis mellifera caucasica]KAG9432433.1 BRISC and BRCA1-A complex member 2 [Apis mellifera carnica]|eukprot:XP_396044.4 BRISC and BRCA1-A complex member 2 [Apis mellifera]